MTLRTVLLTLHVAGGGLGLLAGIFAIRPPDSKQPRVLARVAYAAGVVLLVTFLYAALAIDWAGLGSAQRVIFAVLAVLAAFILVRLFLAFRASQERPANWRARYIGHIYFTYISLWEGFFIVGLIDLGAPGWVVALVAIGVLLIGGYLSNRYKRSVLSAVHPDRMAAA